MSSCSQCCQNPPDINPDFGEGHMEEMEGLKCYVCGPDDSKIAVILFSDVYGCDAPKFRKIADDLAAEGFLAVVPDFFHGDPFVMLEKSWDVWFEAHKPDLSLEPAKLVIETLKSKGIEKIGAAGYCWGAKVVTLLAQEDFLHAGVMLHPSFVTVEDIEKVTKVPMSILGAEVDHNCPPELLKTFEETLKAKPEIDCFAKVFPGVEHGWALRYKDDDEAAVKAAAEAYQDTLDWFVKHLK